MFFRWLAVLAMLLSSGCMSLNRENCACIDTSIADAQAQVDPTRCIGHVRSCYQAIERMDEIGDFSLQAFLNGQPLALELEEACCIAAVNAPIADLIDKERKAACCSIGYNACLDRFLAGQALHRRNKAAATAGQLFLKLVEIHLQTHLIVQSFQRLAELREASRFAAEQGLATDKADKELDANEIDLNRKRLEIEKNQLEITLKLSAILGIERGCLKIIQPIFDLYPVYEPVCLEHEIEEALNRRPDLNAFANDCGTIDPECFNILNQINPSLGIGSQIKKTLVLNRILNNNDPAAATRRQQIQKLKRVRQDLVRVEVADAVVNIESGYRLLVLENEDLQRLRNRMKALDAAGDFNAQDNYIESVQNWVEQQTAQSKRITAAIDFEIAKIKLLEVTGRWTEICGLPGLDAGCNCPAH